jgi:transcriptional antiterminator RfaH
MMFWYVIRSKPNKEEFLAGQLHSRGFNIYLPQLHVKPVNPRARKVRPFFPGYLFVQADDDFRYSDVQWLPGSQGFVNFGDELASLPETIVAGIRKQVDAVNQAEVESRSGFQPKDRVLIVEGVFSGYEAIFDTHISGANRVRVLLSFMKDRQTPLELPETALRKKK